MITGEQIRAARKRAGYSQEKLAELVGVSLRTIGGWERGTNAPGIAEQKLVSVLRDYLDDPDVPPLRGVSDVELLAEVARRLGRTGQRERGDGDVDRDPASMTSEADEPVEIGKVVEIFTRINRNKVSLTKAEINQAYEIARRGGELHEDVAARKSTE